MQAALLRLRIIGVIYGFFSLVGAYDYIMTLTHNMGYFEYLGYGEKQIAYFTNYPILLTILFTLSVWGAVVGSILLVCRLRWSVVAFGVTFMSQLMLDAYTFIFRHRWDVLGAKLCIQDLIVLLLTFAMLLYAVSLRKKGILH
jgi:hypothetical protein